MPSRLAALILLGQASLVAQSSVLEDITFSEVAAGLDRPVAIAHAGGGSGRLFITEQAGCILILDGAQLLPTPFLDISGRVRSGGEQGLLSVAFHPNFASRGEFFVNYTDMEGDTVVSRFRVTGDPNVGDQNSEEVLLAIEQPFDNHNGGQLVFGPDGYLYVGMGDGGASGDPFNRAQDLSTLLGKLLRIDVDVPSLLTPSNPFVGVPGARGEIWALGLRNPWRFTFDRLTGDMFIADVGQHTREEINFQPAASVGGENYGWRLMEGTFCFEPPIDCNDGSLVLPILDYDNGGRASVTGGYRYRGSKFPRLQGVYFYADIARGHIFAATEDNGAWTAHGPREAPGISSFGEDELGEIYFAAYSEGRIFRIDARLDPPQILDGGVTNAASFVPGGAPGSISSLFGLQLATDTEVAVERLLTTELSQVMIEVIDGEGVVHLAQLFFVSPNQVNFLMPAGVALGPATIRLSRSGEIAESVFEAASTAPGLFSMNATGQGVGAILATAVAADDSRSAPEVFRFDTMSGRFVGVPIDLGSEGGSVFLSLFGTGIRGASFPGLIRARVNGQLAPVLGFAPSDEFFGLDQVNVGPLPRSLAGEGEVEVLLLVDGIASNAVTIIIQ